MRLYCAIMLLGILCIFSGNAAADHPVYIQVRISIDTKQDWLAVNTLGLDITWRQDDYIEAVVHPDDMERIKATGVTYEIVHEDVTAFLQSRLPDKAMGAYKTLSEIYAHIDSIIAANPTIMTTRQVIGQTYEGRDMYAFKISDNPYLDEDEPEVLYTSAIHAREVITPEVLLHFIEHLTENYGFDPRVNAAVNDRELWFVLVVNPDGYYYNEVTDPGGGGMWRKNRRNNGDGTYGVDLNRNYGYEWGYDNEGSDPYSYSETYRGTGPFSEPESQVMRDFAIAHEFILSVYFHSHSNLIIWPWGYDELYCPDNDIFQVMGDTMSTLCGYEAGPIWSLYVVNGSTDDWHYGEQTLKPKTFAMSFEVGSYSDNFWPPADRIEPLVSENLGPCMYMAWAAGHVNALAAPLAPTLSVDDTVFAGNYTVSWIHDDTLNPAVAYELIEMQNYTIATNRADDFDGMLTDGFSLSATRYSSPPTSFYSGSGDNFARYVQTTDPYGVQPGDTLKFSTWYDIEANWDYAYVEISTDGVTFTPIPGNITTNSDPNGNNRGNGITGASSGGWVNATFDLSSHVGDDVFFRFSYYTDSYVSEEGIYIDNIFPQGVYGSQTSYPGLTESSMTFSDREAGEYFYKVRAMDAENQWSGFSEVHHTTVVASFTCGDANGDAALNIGDGVYIINYVFKDGPAPNPFSVADANGDYAVNIADAVYLINFVFKDGPSPLCP